MRQLLCIPPLIPLCFFGCFLKTYSLCWEEWLNSVAPSSPKCLKVCYFLEGVYAVGWACCRSSRTCPSESLFPVSSKAQWVPYSDPNPGVGELPWPDNVTPKKPWLLHTLLFCFYWQNDPFWSMESWWSPQGWPSQHFSSLLCQKPPLRSASLFVVSFPFSSVAVGLLVVLYNPGASASAVSARKAVRGFDVSGQLSSA